MVNTTVISPVQPVYRYVGALTGLRAVAAYLVFLHHYNPMAHELTSWGSRLFAQGYVGVTLFFVLSGFLISHRYADAYFQRTNWSWQRYFQNRFARIFPLYLVLLFITVGVNISYHRPTSGLSFILNLTLLKGFFDDYKFSGIPQSWSLTVEECFYALAPAMFLFVRRWGALLLTSVFIGIGLAGAVIEYVLIDQGSSLKLTDNFSFVLFYTFFGRSFEFTAGIWLAHRWHRGRLPLIRWPLLSGLTVACSCVLWQTYVSGLPLNAYQSISSEFIAYNCLLPVGICLIFLGLLHEGSRSQYYLSHPLLQILGRSSYAFYLIHIGPVAKGLERVGVSNTGLQFVLLIAIAWGLYIAVERPLQLRFRAS